MKKKSKLCVEIQPFWKIYYLPKENSQACNKELYEILQSESQIYCLVGANEIHAVSSRASPLFTKQELYALLDIYVFINKQKLLPFTKIPNKKYIHNLFNTLFPDIYKQLINPTASTDKQTKIFETLLPLLEDPRKLNLTKQNTALQKQRLLELLNKKKTRISDNKDGYDFFSSVIANMNNNIKIILKTFDDYKMTQKSQEKNLEKIRLNLEMLKIEYKDSPELIKIYNDNKDIIQQDMANIPKQANVFQPIQNNNFDWDTRRLYDVYTNQSLSTNSKFTIDMWNLLYDEWKNESTKKTAVDMQNIILQMFGLEDSTDNKMNLYKHIQHDTRAQCEIFQHMAQNISLYSDETQHIIFQSVYTVFLDNILLSVDQGDYDRYFIENIPTGLLLDSITMYFNINQDISQNKSVMNRNKYIFNNNIKNIEQYIQTNKSLDSLVSLEKLICHKYNGLSIEKAVSIYAQNNIEKDFIPEALSAVNMSIIFGVCLSHMTGASVDGILPALRRQFLKSKKTYDQIVTFQPAIDVWKLILLPAKQTIMYFIKSNLIAFYLEQLLNFSEFVFSQQGVQQKVVILILSAICNSFKWSYFENQARFQDIYAAFVSMPTKTQIIAQQCISKIIQSGWRQQFKDQFIIKPNKELKWIVFNSDILSLSQFEEHVQTQLSDIQADLVCILCRLGVLTTQKIALIYAQVQYYIGNSQKQELSNICKQIIPEFIEKNQYVQINTVKSIDKMLQRQEFIKKLDNLNRLPQTQDVLNQINQIQQQIQAIGLADNFSDMDLE